MVANKFWCAVTPRRRGTGAGAGHLQGLHEIPAEVIEERHLALARQAVKTYALNDHEAEDLLRMIGLE